jgi:hypothetical protein
LKPNSPETIILFLVSYFNMLDALPNISILNHFLQNVTCSMWAE